MIPVETLNLIKIILVALCVFMVVLKLFKIVRYNKDTEEPITYRLIGRFSSMEIDKSYTSSRRKALQYCNRLTAMLYFFLILLLLVYSLPTITRTMGLG
jgi:hypothetical protein